MIKETTIRKPIKKPVNSQVTFATETNKKITVVSKKLGVTRSKLINSIVTTALAKRK